MIFCSFVLSFTRKNLWRLKKEVETLPNFTTTHPVNCCLQIVKCLFWKVTKELLGRAFSVVVQDALRLLEVSPQRHLWLFTWQKEPEIAFQTVHYFHTFVLTPGQCSMKRAWLTNCVRSRPIILPWEREFQMQLDDLAIITWLMRAEVRSGLCTAQSNFSTSSSTVVSEILDKMRIPSKG